MHRLLVALAIACPAHADWPSARGNAARTGTARGTSNLVTPQVSWRSYLGGAIPARALAITDVDSDGNQDVVAVTGGRVVARNRFGVSLWQSRPMGAKDISRVADIDQDGADDIVIATETGVVVLEAQSGAQLWRQPAEDIGSLAAIRWADLNGDGLEDLIALGCPCCRLSNGNFGQALSFAAGTSAPQKLFDLPTTGCGIQYSSTVVETGAGRRLLIGQQTQLTLLDAGGNILDSTPDTGSRTPLSRCVAADIDGDPDEEVICFQSWKPASGSGTGHKVTALIPENATLTTQWTADVGTEDHALSFGADSIIDLEADGTIELVLSGEDAGIPLLVVLDAQTGTLKAQLAGYKFIGVLNNTIGAIVAEKNTEIAILTYNSAAGTLTEQALFSDARLIAQERDADKSPLRLGVHDNFLALQGRTNKRLSLYSKDDLSQLATTMLGTEAVALIDTGALLLSTANGQLSLRDGALSAILPAIRLGGYFAPGQWRTMCLSPVTSDVPSPTIHISDAEGNLITMTAANATLTNPPDELWRKKHSDCPVVSSGGTRVVARERKNGVSAVVSLDAATGTENWRTTIAGDILAELVVGEFSTTDGADVIVQWSPKSNNLLQHRCLAGASGLEQWNSPALDRGTTVFPSGGAVAEMTGDTKDDFVGHHRGTYILDGTTGAVDRESATDTAPYYGTTTVNVDSDPALEVYLSAGNFEAKLLDSDLSELWQSPNDNRPFPYHAITRCNAELVAVGTSLLASATVTVTNIGDNSLGMSSSFALADGSLFQDEATAVSAGATLSQLTSVYIHENLQGDNAPIVLLGSDNGWLYGVDICAQMIRFALPFNGPVGAFAFSDSDNDGHDEIVVSVGDGFLYGLDQFPLLAPEDISDTDPEQNPSGRIDVDQITTRTSASATWAEVQDADSYEVALIRDYDGEVIVDWTAVSDTAVVFTGLSLDVDVLYRFAVRAVSTAGNSPEALSDGFVAIDDGFTVAGGGCNCRSTSLFSLLTFVLVVLVFFARRKSLADR